VSTVSPTPDTRTHSPGESLDLGQAATLWRTLAGNLPPGTAVTVLRGKRTRSGSTVTELLDVVTTETDYLAVVQRAESPDTVATYLSVNALDLGKLTEIRKRKPGARGGSREVAATLAIVADLDAAHGVHKSPEQLPTTEQLPALLDGLPAPSLVVDTGGGWHVWWALSTPCTDTDTAKRARTAIRGALKRNADALGVHVDAGVTTDAARILRVPGTWNRKGTPTPVRIITEGAPVDLLDLLALDAAQETAAVLDATTAAPPPLARPVDAYWDTFTGPERSQWIADAVRDFDARTTWAQVLPGWTPVGTDGTYWRRPGNTESMKSAEVHRDNGRLIVYSESTNFGDTTGANGQYRTWDKLDAAIVATGGVPDPVTRVELLRGLGYGPTSENRGPVTATDRVTPTPEGKDMHLVTTPAYGDDNAADTVEPSSWDPVDLSTYLDGTYTPATPTLLPRTDGVCLLYPGLVHSVHGESESGKSLIMQAEMVRAITAGLPVLMLDFESDAAEVTARLLSMGATPTDVRDHFTYVRPETSVTAGPDLDAYRRLLSRTYTLAVIDGVTDALGMWSGGGAKSGDNDDIARFMRRFPRKLAQLTGAAVVLIDHVTKDPESRGRWAIGGQAKMAGIDGAAYTVEVSEVPTPGGRGVLSLRIGKDRPGQVRRHCGHFRKSDRTQGAARIVVDSTGPVTVLTVDPWPETGATDDGAGFRPTGIMEKVSKTLEMAGSPLSLRDLREMVGGRAEHVGTAVQLLAADGYVTRSAGARGAQLHTSTRSYRQVEDPQSDRYAGTIGRTPEATASGSQGTGNQSPTNNTPTPSGSGSLSKDRGTGNHSIGGSRPVPGTTGEPVGNHSEWDASNPWLTPTDAPPGEPVHACSGPSCQVVGCTAGGAA
jgi:hypothetical protein